ncbi:BTAD domain-containing putative transcriptional regulator [Phytomonospora endophytica]|uniref:Putative ATPase/DNA-binding SARP family transcriptional activator/tetratricopeptide (TPR) repeat protein n=1 Tax=Phytomonospora endophytica TaxID=714109 RepID=A0A841FBB0_9ACTN|nr:BTAD domain-containing putative transcriptional regulator [Phytomonospora endophytica]MBB6032595.1 putative ATPase/DNA-binding SARP family transcriptional activator/tetratricopeptide (TPR) repeat protein [Phytomonospora endophytica]GIG66255.1 SARP family transcriptional regulator [Phytomonospora endophytica]
MRFGVLGPLAVWPAPGAPVAVPETKVRLLLADLLAHAGEPVGVDRLIDDLWGAGPPADPRAALRVKVSQLRRVVGRDLITHTARGYVLLSTDIDAADFETALSRASASPDPMGKAELLTGALALWRGEAFTEFATEHFARPAITRLGELRLSAVEELAEARLELGEHVRVAADLSALVTAHPGRERLRAAHLLALYRSGRHAEAVAGFTDHRERLREDLGLDPGPEMAALHRAMLAHDTTLLPVTRPRPPTPPHPLLGRDNDLAAVHDLLGGARLVTLHGPGGVGKTRLALATGASAFAELGALPAGSPGEAVASVVAAALGIRDTDDLFAAGLTGLLLLDNCEHVLDAVAGLAAKLLRGAPGLRILATSREPLNLTGERVHHLAPLAKADAVRLFTARAGPAARADDERVAEICRRLDGLPLALELAAARVRGLGVDGVAEGLGDRFALLTDGPRDAPARQRTLRAVVDWSWEPLPPEEKALLRRLAVFAGGADPRAVEAVCGDGARLARLVDRALVTTVHSAGRVRYGLLDTIAAYGLERLRESGEETAVRERHRSYFTALAEKQTARLRGPGQLDALAVLDTETPNLRVALDERLAVVLAWYWHLRGRRAEARRAFAPAEGPEARTWRAVLDIAAGEEPDPPARAAKAHAEDPRPEAAWLLGDALFGLGSVGNGEDLNDIAHSAATDVWGTAATLVARARRATIRGHLAAAEKDATRALTLTRDGWLRSQAREELALLAEIAGEHERSARLRTQALADARELGLPTAPGLARLGRTALLTGDLERARALHERALAAATESGDEGTAQFADVGLALIDRREGALDEAETRLERWLDWCRRRDGDAGLALILAELGFVAEARGEADRALALHREGLAAARRFGDPRAVAYALEGIAGAYGLKGRPGLAGRRRARAGVLRAGG